MLKRTIYLIPLIAFVAVAFAVVFAYRVDQENYAQSIRSHVQDELEKVKVGLVGSLHEKVHLASALRSAIHANPDMTQSEFEAIAKALMGGIHDIRSLQLAKDNVVSHIFPATGVGLKLGQNPAMTGPVVVKSMAKRAMVTGEPQLVLPDEVTFKVTDIIAFIPVSKVNGSGTEDLWGLITFYVDTEAFLGDAGLLQEGDVMIALRSPKGGVGRETVLSGESMVFDMDPVVMEVPAMSSVWQLAGAPRNGWTASPYSKYIIIGGAACLAIIPALTWVIISIFMSRFEDRQKYRQLVQSAKSIILRIDMGGEIAFCNEYAESFYGYEPGELVGKPLIGTISPSKDLEGQSNKRSLSRLLKDPSAHPFSESMSICKNGEIVWVSWANEPIYASDGTMVGLLCVGTDITDRKKMEESLRQREKQYRLLAENVTDVIWGLDAGMRYTYVSPSDEAVRGFKRHLVIGQPVEEFLTPTSRVRLADALSVMDDRLSKQSSPPSITEDLEFLCDDGSTVWLESRLGILLNEDGEKIGIQGVSRDITDRKLVEALREDMERMAKHDLKAPLGAVTGLPGEIRRLGPLSGTQKALLDTIEDAGISMLKLINRSLDLYKMECGTFVLNRAPVDVVHVLESIKTESQKQIRDKGISVGIEVLDGNNDGEFRANVDRELFKSMLSNLLINALEASPVSGTISIILEKNGNTSIAIRNQGEVPFEMRDTFFDKYTTASKASGSGLGTYSARLIARTHGGDVAVDTSVPGETGVVVTVPL